MNVILCENSDVESRGSITHNRLTCFTGKILNKILIARDNNNKNEKLLYRKQIKYKSIIYTFTFGIIFLSITCALSYFFVKNVCTNQFECNVYLITFITMILWWIAQLTNMKCFLSHVIMFQIENNCAFFVKKNESNTILVRMIQGAKTKRYDSMNQQQCISLLHCKITESCMVKIGLFHLSDDERFHQAMGCDVNDYLNPSSSSTKYHNVGIMVAFYYDSKISISRKLEAIEIFRIFLTKSGFTIVMHKLNFVIVAVKRQSPLFESWLIQEDEEEMSIKVQIPFNTDTRDHASSQCQF